jgi:hypothetical protein
MNGCPVNEAQEYDFETSHYSQAAPCGHSSRESHGLAAVVKGRTELRALVKAGTVVMIQAAAT